MHSHLPHLYYAVLAHQILILRDDYLSVFLMFALPNFNAYADDEPIPTVNNATPKVKLESPSVITLNAGEEKDISLTIRNVGAAMAYNNLTQASVESSAPFTISFVNDSNAVPVISATGKKIMKLHINVDKNAKAGSYTVTLNHSFTNDENTNYSDSDTFNVKIKNEVETLKNFINKTFECVHILFDFPIDRLKSIVQNFWENVRK